MGTYNKPLKQMIIYVHGLTGTPIEITDTTDKMVASAVLSELESQKMLHIPTDGGMVIVPYHAVVNGVVSIEMAEVTKDDAYCKTGVGDCAVVGTAKTDESVVCG